MINKFWASLVGALLLLNTPAAFAQEPQCAPAQQMLQQIKPERTMRLDTAQTARVVAWFDAQPPEGPSGFDLAILIKSGPVTGLLLGKGETVCFAGPLNGDELQEVLKVIAGGEGA